MTQGTVCVVGAMDGGGGYSSPYFPAGKCSGWGVMLVVAVANQTVVAGGKTTAVSVDEARALVCFFLCVLCFLCT